MADQEDELKSENQADDGENVDKESAGKDSKDWKQIAEDQKKRAEKSEAENKALKAEKKQPQPEQNQDKINAQQSDPLEVAKIANVLSGLTDEAIIQLTAVAKAKGIPLAEAKKDPLFTAWHDQVTEAAKKERAKRGASRGSSQDDEDDNKLPEGLVPDIHKPLDSQRSAHMEATRKLMRK